MSSKSSTNETKKVRLLQILVHWILFNIITIIINNLMLIKFE